MPLSHCGLERVNVDMPNQTTRVLFSLQAVTNDQHIRSTLYVMNVLLCIYHTRLLCGSVTKAYSSQTNRQLSIQVTLTKYSPPGGTTSGLIFMRF